MKIVHIGTADNRGGAAHAAFHLHEALLKRGHDSRMLVGQKFENRAEIERVGYPKTLLGRIGTRAVLEFETHSGLQYVIQPWRRDFLTHRFTRDADVIHLHNLHGNYFSPRILPMLSKMAPLVWTLHDTWGMTGHCTYNYDCDRWRTGCGHCPNLEEHPRISIDTTRFLWRMKKRLYANSDLTIAAPSSWMARMARESPLFKDVPVHHIPYGLGEEWFAPVDRIAARKQLGLPVGVPVIMTVVLAEAKRKGAGYFVEALRNMKRQPQPLLLVVGSHGLLDSVPEGFKVHESGYLPRDQMRAAYSAADVFVLPTLADNLPVSILEASACGAPTASFNIGGVPDIIRHRETGYVARHMDAVDLAAGLDWLLEDPGRLSEMRSRVRRIAESEYTGAAQASRYETLYRLVTERRAVIA